MTEAAARTDLERLERRLDMIDQAGTRGVGTLAVQVQELAKDLAKLEISIEAHRGEHQAEARTRISGRRWVIGIVIAAIAAIDGPLITLLIALAAH